MNQWIRFFVGSPRRFLCTLVGLAGLGMIVDAKPGLVSGTLNNVLNELQPVVGMLIVTGLTILIMTHMIRSIFKGK